MLATELDADDAGGALSTLTDFREVLRAVDIVAEFGCAKSTALRKSNLQRCRRPTLQLAATACVRSEVRRRAKPLGSSSGLPSATSDCS